MAENVAEKLEVTLDNETGEEKPKVVYYSHRRLYTNAETGEPESYLKKIIKKQKFQVPIKYLGQNIENRSFKMKGRRKTIRGYYFPKSKIQSKIMSAIILTAKQSVTSFVLVLPTLLIFPGWASILCLVWEACMHIWSHKRNKKKKNRYTEYRSPLHLLSSQFCIHCRSQKWKEKISEIQHKRTLRRKISQKYIDRYA